MSAQRAAAEGHGSQAPPRCVAVLSESCALQAGKEWVEGLQEKRIMTMSTTVGLLSGPPQARPRTRKSSPVASQMAPSQNQHAAPSAAPAR